MNMVRKTAALGAAAAMAVVGFTATAPLTARAATPGPCGDTETGMTLGDGADAYTTTAIDQTSMRSDAQAALRKIRQDAYDDTTVTLKDGRTVQQELAARGMSLAQYLAPAWSYDLERIAIQRAVETYNWSDGHKRPNQEGNSSVASNGVSTWAEILAAQGDPTIDYAINSNWKSEKPHVSNGQTDYGDAGHYLELVDPSFVAFGFGRAANMQYGSVFAGEGSQTPLSNSATTNWSGQCEFKVPLSQAKLDAGVTITPTSAVEGQTKTLTAKAAVDDGRYTLRGSFTSATTSVATTSGQTITAVKAGTTQVSLVTGSLTTPATTFTVTARAVDSVVNPAGVTTASGTYPTLPTQVTANWNDGTTSPVAVTWDAMPASQYAARDGGTYTLNGTAGGKPVTIQVTVTPATITGVSDATTTTPAGIAPALPASVQATWSNGDTSTENVTWDAVAPSSYATAGNVFDVAGTVAGYAGKAKTTVTVTAAIATTADPATVTTIATHAPTLPATVAVHWSDGTVTQEAVTWPADSPGNYNTPGTYTLTAPLSTTSGRTADGKPLTATVTVTVSPRTIVAVSAPAPITVESGTQPTLPATVKATYNDGATAMVPVTWPTVTKDQYGARAGGTFNLPGTVAGFTPGTVQILTVNPAKATAMDYTTQTVTTVEGVAPVLAPTTTTVHWSNGDATTETITWGAVASSQYAGPGSFTVAGTVSNWSAPVQLNVVVTAKQLVRVEPFADVTTTVGTAPVLPDEATLTWNNGTTSTSPVTWNAVPAAAYAQPGTFVVTGVTAAGQPVTVTVVVNALPAPAPSPTPTPTTPPASPTPGNPGSPAPGIPTGTQTPGLPTPAIPPSAGEPGLADTGSPVAPWAPFAAVGLIGTGAALARRRH